MKRLLMIGCWLGVGLAYGQERAPFLKTEVPLDLVTMNLPLLPALPEPEYRQDFAQPVFSVDDDVKPAAAIKELNDHGFLALEAGLPYDALQYFKKAYLMDKNNHRARMGVGMAFLMMKRDGDALSVFNSIMEMFPDDYVVQNNTAWLLVTQAEPTLADVRRALRLAQDALLQMPRDHRVWSTLSEAYYVAGDYLKALRAASESVELARALKAPASQIQSYQQQVEKCTAAVDAFTLFE